MSKTLEEIIENNRIYKISGLSDYFISKNGNIFSAKSKSLKKLKPSKNQGYFRIGLYDNNKSVKFKFIHRLLADTFIENPKKLRCVNHIDGDKTNNSLDNLEWCTHQENSIHAVKNNLIKSNKNYKYSKHGVESKGDLRNEKLLVSITKEYFKSEVSSSFLGRKYSIVPSTLRQIFSGRRRPNILKQALIELNG